MTESRHSGHSNVEAVSSGAAGSTPEPPGIQVRSGACVSRASWIAQTGMNEARPLHAWSSLAKQSAMRATISSSTV
jgi:hypothetical protein